ncbi:MAG: hypothetical protein VW935_18980, partial [Novosphingobium sp.]
ETSDDLGRACGRWGRRWPFLDPLHGASVVSVTGPIIGPVPADALPANSCSLYEGKATDIKECVKSNNGLFRYNLSFLAESLYQACAI